MAQDNVRLAKFLIESLGLPPGPLSIEIRMEAGKMAKVTCVYPLLLDTSKGLAQELKLWELRPVESKE